MSQQVQEMFAGIADDYDRTNTVLSLGVHRRWRNVAVRMGAPRPGMDVLDIATGTGDLAFAWQRAVGEGRVVGVDFCEPMLQVARRKAAKQGPDVDFQWADALELPYGDNSFDVASIAFGIRNVDEPRKAVAEMARVVRPGGRVVVLEFGQPRGVLGMPYRLYSRHVMPRLGGLLTGDRRAYEYLPETAARFPSGDAFVQLMQDAAVFDNIRQKRLTGGIAFAYAGVVAGH